MSDVMDWTERDLTAAVLELVTDAERCDGCGTLPDEAKHVEAKVVSCPVCEDRDRKRDNIKKHWQGKRVVIASIADPDEAAEFSSHARFTWEGAKARFQRRYRSQG